MQFLKNMFKRIKNYRTEFVLGTFFRVLGDMCTLYPAYALGYIITTVSNGNFEFSNIIIVAAIWCVLMSARQFLITTGKWYIYVIAEKIEIDVLQEGLGHLLSLDSAWHEDENSGNKIKKIQNAAESYNLLTRIWVNNVIEIVVNFIGISFIVSRTDNKVMGFIVFYILVYYFISTSILKRARVRANLINIADEQSTGILFESVNSIRTVKLLSIKEYILSRYKEANSGVLLAFKNTVIWFQGRIAITNVWTHVTITSAIVFIAYGITQGVYEVGFIALFYSYMSSIRESVGELANISETIMLSGQKVERYEEFKAIEINTESTEGKVEFPKSWNKISLDSVSFSYKEEPVLSGLNIEIKKGEKIGIVGLSGAGKSTLFKLLLKEREDYEGSILFDSTPLKNISPLEYRAHVAVVLQDTEVFNMSLKENITIGAEYNEEYFNHVLEIAHVKEFADRLKEGVDTKIGEKGVKLSGGERQRLGIARALFKKPEILLLDEATSHLDLESEAKIKDSLHKAFADVTAVVIAHRLTTIREMDRILVIEDGKIVEDGNFDSLHKKQGRFYDLWEMQKIL